MLLLIFLSFFSDELIKSRKPVGKENISLSSEFSFSRWTFSAPRNVSDMINLDQTTFFSPPQILSAFWVLRLAQNSGATSIEDLQKSKFEIQDFDILFSGEYGIFSKTSLVFGLSLKSRNFVGVTRFGLSDLKLGMNFYYHFMNYYIFLLPLALIPLSGDIDSEILQGNSINTTSPQADFPLQIGLISQNFSFIIGGILRLPYNISGYNILPGQIVFARGDLGGNFDNVFAFGFGEFFWSSGDFQSAPFGNIKGPPWMILKVGAMAGIKFRSFSFSSVASFTPFSENFLDFSKWKYRFWNFPFFERIYPSFSFSISISSYL